MQLQILIPVRRPTDAAFARIAQMRAGALLSPPTPSFSQREQIIALAANTRLRQSMNGASLPTPADLQAMDELCRSYRQLGVTRDGLSRSAGHPASLQASSRVVINLKPRRRWSGNSPTFPPALTK